MSQINCLNFCEILHHISGRVSSIEETIASANELAGVSTCERIYIGSSFCEDNFLNLSEKQLSLVIDTCKYFNIRVTLVLPVFTEKNLSLGKEKIKRFSSYFEHGIDEITVNDYEMLVYISKNYGSKLNLGRLFLKDDSELSQEEYFHMDLHPKILTSPLGELMKKYRITGMEFDKAHKVIHFTHKPKDIEIGIHTPYCYMTKGRCSDLEDRQLKCEDGTTIYVSNVSGMIKGVYKYRNIYFPLRLDTQQGRLQRQNSLVLFYL